FHEDRPHLQRHQQRARDQHQPHGRAEEAVSAPRRQAAAPRRARAALAAAVVLAALLVAGLALRLAFRAVPRPTPDELFYTRCAIGIVQFGPAFMPEFVRGFIQDPAHIPYPWPNRVGYLNAVAGLMAVTTSLTVETTALLSTIASVVGLLLLWRLGLG